MEPIRVSTTLAGRELVLETGALAMLSGGAVTVRYGDSVVLSTCNISEKASSMGYFPMMVEYREKFFASGKIKGSRFIKREGRPTDDAIINCRLIDRTLRPLFPKYMRNDVQIVNTVLSHDDDVEPSILAMIGSSAACVLAGAPFEGPVAGVRIGLEEGKLVVYPAQSVLDDGDLNICVSGTKNSVVMVEAGAREVDDAQILEAIKMAHDAIQPVLEAQLELGKKFGVKEREFAIMDPREEVLKAVSEFLTDDMCGEAILNKGKKDLSKGITSLEDACKEKFADHLVSEEDPWSEDDIVEAVDKRVSKYMRGYILNNNKRIDGRALDEVRPVSVQVDVLPRPHGSAIFQRGITMALSTVTLGSARMGQIVDSMEEEITKHYLHHYYFPPYCTGEAYPMRGVSRREIGHGDLAERALRYVMPTIEEFPYTVHVVSEILSCNGSTSMASVCGSTLSLMATGVPIKNPVAGIAMGLMTSEDGGYRILSDIQAVEDFCGDMDFKVARTEKGITALQMDIKLKGLDLNLLKEALEQGKKGALGILSDMKKTISEPRSELSARAPRIISFTIDSNLIGDVVGKGGKTIKGIIEEFGVDVDIEDDGLVMIAGTDAEKSAAAERRIRSIVYKPKIGDVFEGEVTRLLDFGAIVQFVGNKDGMVHISEIAKERVNKIEDYVKVGDKVKVKVLEIGDRGRYSLSMKAVRDSDQLAA